MRMAGDRVARRQVERHVHQLVQRRREAGVPVPAALA
jgi:hypothetical protein